MRRHDLAGLRFGRLLVIEAARNRTGPDGRIYAYWSCLCDCGMKRDVRAGNLRTGQTVSCGCKGLEELGKGRAIAERIVRQWRKVSAPRVFGNLTLKQCAKCLKDLVLADFYTATRASCKACDKLRIKASQATELGRSMGAARYRSYVANLDDSYVRRLLRSGFILRASDIPAPLIEAKRAHLKVKRLLRE